MRRMVGIGILALFGTTGAVVFTLRWRSEKEMAVIRFSEDDNTSVLIARIDLPLAGQG